MTRTQRRRVTSSRPVWQSERSIEGRQAGARTGQAAIRRAQRAAKASWTRQLQSRLNEPQSDPLKELGQEALRAVLREAVHRRSWSASVVVKTLDGWHRALERAERAFRMAGMRDAADIMHEIRDWLEELPPHHTLPYLHQCRACKRFFFDCTRGHTKRSCNEAHKKYARRHPWNEAMREYLARGRPNDNQELIFSVGDRRRAPT